MNRIAIYLHGSSKPLNFLYDSAEEFEDQVSALSCDLTDALDEQTVLVGDDRGTVGFLKRDFHFFEVPTSHDEGDDEEDGPDEPVLNRDDERPVAKRDTRRGAGGPTAPGDLDSRQDIMETAVAIVKRASKE